MTKTALPKPTTINPSKLAPDFDNIPGELVSEEFTFWLGVTADCPRGQIDVAGLNFPKNEEEVIINPAGKQVRVPHCGTINATVTRHHFQELLKVLPRLVIRPSKPVHHDGVGGENTGDPIQNAKGRLIKIPDEAMIAGVAETGRKLKPYVKQPGDRPAIEFMFFVHAPSGHRGAADGFQTIAETGLEWPVEIPSKKSLPEPAEV